MVIGEERQSTYTMLGLAKHRFAELSDARNQLVKREDSDDGAGAEAPASPGGQSFRSTLPGGSSDEEGENEKKNEKKKKKEAVAALDAPDANCEKAPKV